MQQTRYVQNTIIILVLAALAFFAYKYYKVKKYLDNEFISAAKTRGTSATYGMILPFPLNGVTIYDLQLKNPLKPTTPVYSIEKLVVSGFENSKERNAASLEITNWVFNFEVIPDSFQQENEDDFKEVSEDSPLLAFFIAPFIFPMTNEFETAVAESENYQMQYASFNTANAKIKYEFDHKQNELALSYDLSTPNFSAMGGDIRIGIDKTQFSSFSPRRIMRAITVIEGSLYYLDDGFYQFYLEDYLSKQVDTNGLPPQDWLLNHFHASIVENEIKLWPDIKQSIEQFIMNPTGLKLAFKPEKPIMIRDFQFYNPWDIPALLNSEATIIEEL